MAGERTVQEHHIIYPSDKNKEETVIVFKGEHGVLTKMQWWCKGKTSVGFLKALKVFIALREDRAIELTKEKE